jgi:hypothetical protein
MHDQLHLTDYEEDLFIVLDQDASLEQQQAAAERLARVHFTHPIPAPRWDAHRPELQGALAERANDEASWSTILHQVTVRAILIAALEARRPRSYVDVSTGGTRFRYGGQPGGKLTPRDDLPFDWLDQWFRARVAHEVMADLVPDWRELEARRQHGVWVASAETPPGDPADPVSDQVTENIEEQILARLSLSEVLASEPPHVVELIQLVLDGYTATEVGRRLGHSDSWGRVMLARLRARLQNLAG